MVTKFDKISGTDEIFNNKEYLADSVIFNSIESARIECTYDIYSDHKNVIILTAKRGHRVWLWTSGTIKDDTNRLIDICRFIRDCKIPQAEIYLKHDVAENFSDLYALATLELNYVVRDEYSLAVYEYDGEKLYEAENGEDERIIRIDKDNAEHIKLVTDFYRALSDEFGWNNKFDRKVNEYLNTELYALVRDGKMIANAAIGSPTEKYLRIKSVAVLEDERRKGYGYKMCVFAVNKIKERERTPMLYTHVGNAAAVSLWNKTGFNEKDKLYLLKLENN